MSEQPPKIEVRETPLEDLPPQDRQLLEELLDERENMARAPGIKVEELEAEEIVLENPYDDEGGKDEKEQPFPSRVDTR